MSGPVFPELPEQERARVYALLKRAMTLCPLPMVRTFAAAINTLTEAAGDTTIPPFRGEP